MPAPSPVPSRAARGFWCAAAALLALHAAFAVWAVAGSYFFVDDYRLLLDSHDAGALSWTYLMTPFDSQFMPGGRLLVWLVDQAGTTAWWAAGTTVVVMRVAAAGCCLWMLLTLFGRRREVLLLLALYQSSAITLPATMWWAAALNQLPLQITLFAGVATGVRYLRAPSWRSVALLLAVLTLGLCFYVKAVLLAPVLAFVALTCFTHGTWRRRLRGALRYWHALVAGTLLLGGFSAAYLLTVPQAFEGTGTSATAAQVADAMLLRALPAGLLGGPWRWLETSLPLAIAGPPDVAVTLAWVALALLVSYLLLRFRGAWSALLLVVGYAVALFLLLLFTRGQLYGGFAALDYRYLTDVACIVPLALGLACLPVRGSPSQARVRDPALLGWRSPFPLTAALVALVALSGTWSATTYVGYWHEDNAGADWVPRVQAGVADLEGPVDMVDQPVPPEVMPAYTRPADRTSRLLDLVAPEARFPAYSEDLYAVAPDGRVAPAVLEEVVRSTDPESETCARILEPGSSTTLRLDGVSGAARPWLRVGYLSSAQARATVSAGDTEVGLVLREGLHQVFVRTSGQYDEVTLRTDDGGGRVCLDQLEIGQPAAAPELP